MDLILGNEIRPGRASVQEQREVYLDLKDKHRWSVKDSKLKGTGGLGQEIAGFE